MITRIVCSLVLVLVASQARAASAVGVKILPAAVGQGGSVEVIVTGIHATHLQVRFAGRVSPLYRSGQVWRTYLGTDPLTRPGSRGIVVEGSGPSGAVRLNATVLVRRTAFPTRRLTLDPSRRGLLDPRLAEEEGRKVSAALRLLNPDPMWRGPFRVPVRGSITSPYGVVSFYCHADCVGSQRRQGQMRGFHRGVDLAAPTGTPVYAAHDGIVRLAEKLPLSGNAVLIDHGMGIVTSYLHQSVLLVRAGQRVRRGQTIGRVGSTGLSTGPHLHWGLRVNGVHVDPMPWTVAKAAP